MKVPEAMARMVDLVSLRGGPLSGEMPVDLRTTKRGYIVVLEHMHANTHLPAGQLYRVVREEFDNGIRCLVGRWSSDLMDATPLNLETAREACRRFRSACIRVVDGREEHVQRPLGGDPR